MWWRYWSIVAAVASLQGQHFSEAQGGTGSVNAQGIEALGENPAGLLQSRGRWEFSLPGFSAQLVGMTVREYTSFFGGVETPAGYQPRRLTVQERAEFVALLERQPVFVEAAAQPLALLWKPSAEHALAFGMSVQLWMQAQAFEGATAAARQPVIGGERAELRGGKAQLRLYSMATLGYARRLWHGKLASDPSARLRWGELVGGVAVHLYRGHRYEELLPGAWFQLQPFLSPSWDSTFSWDVSGRLLWRHADAGASALGLALGVAPAVGWGVGVSLGLRWEWRAADTLPVVAALGLSLEHAGFLHWKLMEATLQWEHDTISGILGTAWDAVRVRFTPARQTLTRVEALPLEVRLGAALELMQTGIALPVRLSVEYQQRVGAEWSRAGGYGGIGLLLYPLTSWMPGIGVGALWSATSSPQFPAGLRWELPAVGRQRTVFELLVQSLSSWLFPTRVWHFGGAARVWMFF
ncbi:hypothetical protein HRbin21_00396 [bacterium HR21]|jgi:hypothetical protein|nr:hypothetical protein HRbin21_00396 [bacterium HR21]